MLLWLHPLVTAMSFGYRRNKIMSLVKQVAIFVYGKNAMSLPFSLQLDGDDDFLSLRVNRPRSFQSTRWS